MWKGGNNDTVFRWISMIVPDGDQWLEDMVDTGTPSPRTLGIWNHLAFGTLDQQAVAKQVLGSRLQGPQPRRLAATVAG